MSTNASRPPRRGVRRNRARRHDVQPDDVQRDDGDPSQRRVIEPLDPPMVPFAVGGIAAWAIAGLILLALRPTLVEHGHQDWLWICLAGFLVGLPGLLIMMRHDANRRRRRAAQKDG